MTRSPETAAQTFAAVLHGLVAGVVCPMTALGVADPRTWAAKDWVSDVIPHMAYGAVTALVLQGLDKR